MSWTERDKRTPNWTERSVSSNTWKEFERLQYLLCEDGGYLLREDGTKILLESSINTRHRERSRKSPDWTEKARLTTNWR